MENLKIGQVIYQLRKERGITQEKLADFLGISTAAVSKWESGQSYPDITLLPIIASYFDISIDNLMGFVPDISKEEVMEHYRQLATAFATEDFDETLEKCKALSRKYHNSFFLQLHIANLLLNHLDVLPDKARIPEILEYIMCLYKRIISSSGDSKLVHQAVYTLSICHLTLGNADDAIAALDGAVDSMLPKELILAQAYHMKGDVKNADETLQTYIYQCLVGLQNACPTIAILKMPEPGKALRWFDATAKTFDAFDFKSSNPMAVAVFYCLYGRLYLMLGDTEKALEKLHIFRDIAVNDETYPIAFRNSDIFDSIESAFAKFDLGTSAPRADMTIRKSCYQVLANDPVWAGLQGNADFEEIKSSLSEE